jgi:hypothetical protein
MGKGALVMGFLPALVAGLLMGYFLNAYPDAGSGRVGDKVEQVEYDSPIMEALDKFLLPAFFIVMILFALKAIFNIGLLGLVSALLGYAGMLMIMSGVEFFGFMYLLFGGMLCRLIYLFSRYLQALSFSGGASFLRYAAEAVLPWFRGLIPLSL